MALVYQVLTVPMVELLHEYKTRRGKGRAPEETFRTIRGFYRLPRLLYIPYRWDKKAREEWEDMDHWSKLVSTNDRAYLTPF